MSYVLTVEAIGHVSAARGRLARLLAGPPPSSGWCARVTFDCGTVHREFLRPLVDYAAANSVGSRGVTKTWLLPDGLYQVHQKISWKRSRAYYLAVRDGAPVELPTKREAEDMWELWQSEA